MIERLRRIRFTVGSADRYRDRRALVRALWHTAVLGYDGEICKDCGRCVAAHVGSYWRTADSFWERVVGSPSVVLCPRCFTRRAKDKGIFIYWMPFIETVDRTQVMADLADSATIGNATR